MPGVPEVYGDRNSTLVNNMGHCEGECTMSIRLVCHAIMCALFSCHHCPRHWEEGVPF